MERKKQIRVGIGFATGRKNFQKILKTYVYNFLESGLTENSQIHISLLVAYDLKYANTLASDYTGIPPYVLELLDDVYFIGSAELKREREFLLKNHVIDEKEAALIFEHGGYASKRNAILYTAVKNRLDYLLFLDDDEYPLAVANTSNNVTWGGQQVLSTHLRYIKNADLTNGYHCGYISPIPYIAFDSSLSEATFRSFTEAISNDIINWNSIRSVMQNGGVTYADPAILNQNYANEVRETMHTKFISGSNLCLNLTDPNRVYPFYNPPGARGEDTFLSTCLSHRRVMRVPCYTFHDGFSTYPHLMDGVLPTKLRPVNEKNAKIINRFYRACIGWVRYKPLLLYITQRDSYQQKVEDMRSRLNESLPQICSYFEKEDFMSVLKELETYHKSVVKDYNNFQDTQHIWRKLMRFLYNKEILSQRKGFLISYPPQKSSNVKIQQAQQKAPSV